MDTSYAGFICFDRDKDYAKCVLLERLIFRIPGKIRRQNIILYIVFSI